MGCVKSNFSRILIFGFFLGLSFDITAATAPINIHCPCEIERVNKTKAKKVRKIINHQLNQV